VTEPAGDLRYQVVLAVDAGDELSALIAAAPTKANKPSLRSLLKRPGAWAAFLLHNSSEPSAELVRRICNQADVYSVAAHDIGTSLGETSLVDAAQALTKGSAEVWAKQIDIATLQRRSLAVSDLLRPHERRTQLGQRRPHTE
jgi:hypothetical protein